MAGVRRCVAALIAASVLQAACAAKPVLDVRPAEEIASRPLDPAVDAAMVIELAQYAAKDRLCAQSSRGRPPIMHAPYGHYIRCMYERQGAPCEATAEDLRTVRTLLDRDPRLAAILSFEQLFARLQSDCAGHGNLPTTARAVRIWAPRHLENCEVPYQPVLITAAIMLRTLPPRDAEGSIFWYGGCRGAAGYFFLEGHCLRLRRLEGRKQPEEASRLVQGIEAYFCPQIAKYFGA
jgi:hypothetical protein